ncbi:pyridoxamine 5'-phosphate oxidase family protein [Herbiconiux sp. YIM B11900]|uniref:pyridoxamine 5'-phosphate oxidase family protein n=1 Tax=Herbiconiux sp. YIM B11900 TaxID=3404131 RepID=UPI003F879DC8
MTGDAAHPGAGPLGASDPAGPLGLLRDWCGLGYPAHPPLMTVGTIGLDGLPDARSLLLSGVDEAGTLYFHTDARSRKCAQLDANAAVSLTLAWPDAGRQLVVAGVARLSGDEEADRAWAARSRYLRLLGWLNDDDLVRRPRPERERRWAEFDAAHPDASLARPVWWVGYGVQPLRVTAWTAGRGIGSERREFRRDGDSGRWRDEVLAG